MDAVSFSKMAISDTSHTSKINELQIWPMIYFNLTICQQSFPSGWGLSTSHTYWYKHWNIFPIAVIKLTGLEWRSLQKILRVLRLGFKRSYPDVEHTGDNLLSCVSKKVSIRKHVIILNSDFPTSKWTNEWDLGLGEHFSQWWHILSWWKWG